MLLNIAPHFPKMALDAFPGAAGGDAKGFVIVTAGTTAGEGVAEPEAVLLADGVGGVGQMRRPLVGRHHQIRVEIVVADHPLGMLDPLADPVVGEIEQPAHQGLVGGLGEGCPLFPSAPGGFDDETALGTDRDDQGIFGHLGFHQTENLGAEIIGAVGPADSPPGHIAAPQVNPLHGGGVDVNFKQRPRRRHVDDPEGADFERKEIVLGTATEKKVGAHRGIDEVEQQSQDGIFVDILHLLQGLGQLLPDRRQHFLLPQQGVGPAGVVEKPPLEIAIEQQGHRGMIDQGEGDAAHAVTGAELKVIIAVAAEDVELLPGEPGQHQQPIEIIVAAGALAQSLQSLEQLPAQTGQGRAAGAFPHRKGFDEEFFPCNPQGKIHLLDDAEVEVFQKRHQLVQITGLVAVELQPVEGLVAGKGPPEIELLLAAGEELFQRQQVAQGEARMQQMPVLPGKGLLVTLPEPGTLAIPQTLLQQLLQPQIPGSADAGEIGFDPVEVKGKFILLRMQGHMQTEIGLGDMNDLGRGGGTFKHSAEILFRPGHRLFVIKPPRHDHQQGQPTDRRGAGGDNLDRAVTIEHGKGAHRFQQVFGTHKKEFDLGKGIENFNGFSPVMTVDGDCQDFQGHFNPAPQGRDIEGQLVHCLRGEQTEKGLLPPEAGGQLLAHPEINQGIAAMNRTGTLQRLDHQGLFAQQPLQGRNRLLQRGPGIFPGLVQLGAQAAAPLRGLPQLHAPGGGAHLQLLPGKQQKIALLQPLPEIPPAFDLLAPGAGLQRLQQAGAILIDGQGLLQRVPDSGQQQLLALGGEILQLDDHQGLPHPGTLEPPQAQQAAGVPGHGEDRVGDHLEGLVLAPQFKLNAVDQIGGIKSVAQQQRGSPLGRGEDGDPHRFLSHFQKAEKLLDQRHQLPCGPGLQKSNGGVGMQLIQQGNRQGPLRLAQLSQQLIGSFRQALA